MSTVIDLKKYPKDLARVHSRSDSGETSTKDLLRLSIGGAPMDELVADLHRSPRQIRAKLRSLTRNGGLTVAEAADRLACRYDDPLARRPFRRRQTL